MKLWQKIFVAAFAGLIIFPSAVDLAHVFSGHKHDYCNHYAESHFHQKTVECDLFDFQKNPYPFPPLFSWSMEEPEVANKLFLQPYLYLNTFQKLHFSLRAPPAVA